MFQALYPLKNIRSPRSPPHVVKAGQIVLLNLLVRAKARGYREVRQTCEKYASLNKIYDKAVYRQCVPNQKKKKKNEDKNGSIYPQQKKNKVKQ